MLKKKRQSDSKLACPLAVQSCDFRSSSSLVSSPVIINTIWTLLRKVRGSNPFQHFANCRLVFAFVFACLCFSSFAIQFPPAECALRLGCVRCPITLDPCPDPETAPPPTWPAAVVCTKYRMEIWNFDATCRQQLNNWMLMRQPPVAARKRAENFPQHFPFLLIHFFFFFAIILFSLVFGFIYLFLLLFGHMKIFCYFKLKNI